MDIGAISGGFSYPSINFQSSPAEDAEELLASELQEIELDQNDQEIPSFDAAIDKAMDSQSASRAGIVPPPAAQENSEDLFEEYNIAEAGAISVNTEKNSDTTQTAHHALPESAAQFFEELMPQDIQDMFFHSHQQGSVSAEDNSNPAYASIINQQYAANVNEYLKQADTSITSGMNISGVL